MADALVASLVSAEPLLVERGGMALVPVRQGEGERADSGGFHPGRMSGGVCALAGEVPLRVPDGGVLSLFLAGRDDGAGL